MGMGQTLLITKPFYCAAYLERGMGAVFMYIFFKKDIQKTFVYTYYITQVGVLCVLLVMYVKNGG
jgi:hypothetical protein